MDIAGAVERCKEIVDDDEDIIIDAVLTAGGDINRYDPQEYNSIRMILRYFEISNF